MTTCKECGADFDEHLPECPFCGALNYSGAEEQYLEHLEEIKSDLSDLADDSEQAYHVSMKKSTLIIITTICCLLLAAGLFAGIFFLIRSASSASGSDELQKAQILWRNQYMDTLDEMYADGDYDGIIAFLDEHVSDEGFAPYGWEHLDFIELYDSYINFKDEAILDKNDYISEYTTLLYYAASVDYAAEQDFFTYTEEELELIASYQEETAAFYHKVLGLTDDEIVQMKSEIASNDDLALPTWDNCRNYIIKIKDKLIY